MSPSERDRPTAEAAARLQPLLASEAAAALRAAAAGVPAHLVGGAVRDAWLGHPARDLDTVVERDGADIAARLAARLDGRPIPLGGDAFAAWRIARRDLTVDLWDREGAPLARDLARRDLTVNAIAVDLASGEIVDPCGGLDDLARGLLRAPRSTAFEEDPLRVLRLARLAATLNGFRIDPATAVEARAAGPGLLTVATERVRVELGLALAAREGEALCAALVDLHLYPGLWLGQPGAHGPSEPARRRFTALAVAERWLTEELPELVPRVDRFFLHGTALALDLAEVEPAAALGGFSRRRWLTRRSVASMMRLVPWTAPPPTAAERRWLLHRTGVLWPTGLLVAGSDPAPGADWRQAARDFALLAERHGAQIFDPPPLLDGHELARLTELPPGPELGRWVARLRDLQIEGTLADAEGARRWLAAERARSAAPASRLSSPDAG